MTDLKPGNTIYKVEQKQGNLIDLGGVTKGKDRNDLENLSISKVGQYTYPSPEIRNSE